MQLMAFKRISFICKVFSYTGHEYMSLYWSVLSLRFHFSGYSAAQIYNVGYDQYTVPETVTVKPTFVAFL